MAERALTEHIGEIMAAGPLRLVFSAARPGVPYRRATATPLLGGGWQLERRTATQAFHRNVEAEALAEETEALLREGFTQLTAFTEVREYSLRISKKGRVLATSRALPPSGGEEACLPPAHDRQKRRVLPSGVAVAPLVDIGVLTAEGRPVAAMQDKYRQINRFLEMVDDVLRPRQKAGSLPQPLRVVDFGCGKSYLTFVLYYYLIEVLGIEARVTGLDLKADVVAGCQRAAGKYGYAGLDFAVGDIAGYACAEPVHMVVSLHACDTATDHALAQAAGWGAQWIFSVPCCQHQLNAQMESEALAILTRYGIVKERTAALMTDALRANLLAAAGYKTQLLEFVGFEHTPKNIMIRAVKAQSPLAHRRHMLAEAQHLCEAFSFEPELWGLLEQAGALPAES